MALTGEVVLAHEEMSAALSGIERAGLVSLIFALYRGAGHSLWSDSVGDLYDAGHGY